MKLGEHNVYWHAGKRRDDVIGLLPLANVGLAVTDFLAARHGGEAARGERECVREAAARLGGGPTAAWIASGAARVRALGAARAARCRGSGAGRPARSARRSPP